MTVPFPTKVRVGYRDLTIVEWGARYSDERSSWGEYSGQTSEIRICDALLTLDPRRAAATLLHEILHACYAIGDVSDDDKEERIVTILSNQLAQVWRDNPDVMAYLSENLK